MAKGNIKRILDVELFTMLNIAFVLFLLIIVLVRNQVIDIDYVSTLIQYMRGYDYLILYLILALMSWLISGMFARNLFKKTAIGTYREE